VLGAVALLDAAIIPHNLLFALVEEMCPELTSNVQKLGVLGNLWRCSLISRLTEDLLDKSTSRNCQQDYTVHRVVQQFVLCQMDQNSRHEATITLSVNRKTAVPDTFTSKTIQFQYARGLKGGSGVHGEQG
ncbi:unnamed protein product, partial [Symbiodinium necroappetens]